MERPQQVQFCWIWKSYKIQDKTKMLRKHWTAQTTHLFMPLTRSKSNEVTFKKCSQPPNVQGISDVHRSSVWNTALVQRNEAEERSRYKSQFRGWLRSLVLMRGVSSDEGQAGADPPLVLHVLPPEESHQGALLELDARAEEGPRRVRVQECAHRVH